MSRWNVFCTLAEGPVSARHLMNSGCGSEAEPRDERAFWEAHVLDAEFPSVEACARPRARRLGKSKAVAGGQGRTVVDRSADPVREKCPHTLRRSDRRTLRRSDRRDSRQHWRWWARTVA